jgi:hypothetical protein
MESRYCQNPAVESAPMRGESVLFNPRNSKFCLLNSTAALLWSKLETPQTVQELVFCVESQFEGVDSNVASRDIEVALSQLLDVECVVRRPND